MTDRSVDIGYDDLLFAVRRSVRYHMRRQRFLDRITHWEAMLTAVAGSATLMSFLAGLGTPWLGIMSAATAIFSAFELVFKTGRAARFHNELARDFIGLEQDALRAQATLTNQSLVGLQTRRLEIEAKEPPIYRVLDAICHDELVLALGHPDEQRTNVTRIQRYFANIIDLWPQDIRKYAAN